MPRHDGTGPMGAGPMTGRRTRICNNNVKQGLGSSRGAERGSGRGMGMGSGKSAQRRSFGNPNSAFSQTTDLKNQVEFMETQLKEMKRKLSEMETSE